MSPKQWFCLLCFYISYLFLGASTFYYIEHKKELENRATQLQERISINELLVKYASPEDKVTQDKVLKTLSDYCDRPVTNYTLDRYPVDYEWSFFHSFWFSFITCSTVGYGNSSPHDQPGQAFLIFYALIGLPVNGFVLAYLGEFFIKTVMGIYNRCKSNDCLKTFNHDETKTFGLISTIAMFLVPGIIFFIFLPACIFSYFEDWPYVRSVYYSFVTLTTIGFGDFVPTFQDGQARTFGIYFTFYQIFILFWNFIGVGYFIMIISFIAKGMQSKRIASLEHQLSMNIKETQHRIWTGVTKDVNYLRRVLNEANLMKFKPVYTDSITRETYNSLHRSSSYPEIPVYRNEYVRTSRRRAYSENSGKLSQSSTVTLNRTQSDGDLRHIDKKKTFEGSESLFQTKDLLSNVLTALGSITTINEDAQSCSEFGLYGGLQDQNDSLYEWTWDGRNSQQTNDFMPEKMKKNSITSMFSSKLESTNHSTLNIKDDSEIQMETNRYRSFMSKINPFKDRTLSQEDRRCSVTSQGYNAEKYLEKTSKGRDSRMSSSKLSDNMELLETTTIADLIRAIEEAQTNSDVLPGTPLLGEYREKSKMKVETSVPTKSLRRGSLRPTHDYTTIFMSHNMNKSNMSSLTNRGSAAISRPPPINLLNMTKPKRATRRIRSTSSSIPTVQEHKESFQSVPMLKRTLSLRPAPLPKNTQATNIQSGAVPQMPMITVQAPNVSKRDLLWHPEYQDDSTLLNKMRRKRSDSK